LPVPYAHLVFTLPHALNGLAANHDRWVYDTLMQTVAETLNEFAANPRWLGAEPAFTAVLHTWTQDLRRHVHLHVLIACGGLDEEGNWVEPKRNSRFLFPVHALSQVFRAKFLDALDADHQSGQLPRDPAAAPKDYAKRRQQLLQHDWVVYAKPRCAVRSRCWNTCPVTRIARRFPTSASWRFVTARCSFECAPMTKAASA
jgi:hypothetical protein